MNNNLKFDLLSQEAPLHRLVLEKARVGTHLAVSPQVMHDLDVSVSRDLMSRNLLINLKSYIMRHKVGERELDVKVDQKVRIDKHLPLLATVAGTLEASTIPIFLWTPSLAIIIALLGFIVLFVGLLLYPRKVRVQKYFTIHNDYYNTFPENTYVYPKEVGKVVIQTESYVKEDDDYAR
jgi:hypothetical protein